ncbi:hypothetical protein CHLNCDRAFT_56732 [Chlorella variabilis]|uniref:Knl1 C-terminal RWD domain-containing protein n=1 Tax=Chlorella variabilis TaxID=554065 RepID=E1Z4S1_CHLVA|nr:hypothetical protein CHLNCDRAFT_56732 [Chlorella variabilis]EFN59398.1 hypothetical protein CHLNCDRAFT_56732 [Chlorella variabilis]|eukprot:XP_005851500.1 hypothetical protein CHLNCDRAFT_56732 [Chlorella variabilis]
MRSLTKEARDPNRAGGSAAKKRAPLGRLEASPVKKQQRKKPSKKDRRRVSFAPDPELTLVHHFEKDDDYASNSGGKGRVVVQYEEDEPSMAAQRAQPDAQHPALVGDAGAGASGAYRPGFWNKTVPENSPLSDGMPLDSPGMVSMELTQPTVQLQAAAAAPGPGDVTAGLPSLGALADADEWWEDAQGAPEQAAVAAGWAGAAASAAAANATANITAALPGLGALVAEDEDATAGMDLTLPTGRVLEHHPHPALAPAEAAPEGGAELEPTARVAAAEPARKERLSSGTDELATGVAAKAQMSKWGFAPGADDTLDINLEMHGRMIMGDQTFDRMYCDNTTGDSRLGGRPSLGGADSTADSLLPKDGGAAGGAEDLELEGVEGPAAAAEHGAASAPAAAASPAVSSGAPQRAAQAAAAPAAAQRAPNWTAPAFLPPYMQAPAASGAPSDHPALVHSPDVTGSSLNTLETRRVSVGVDMRRMSISSRRFSMQDATGRLLADFGGEDDVAAAGTAGLHEAAAQAALAAAAPAPAPASGGPRSRRRSSGAAFLGRDVTEKLLVDDSLQEEEAEPVGPLADLRRQMRMLSQGSPVLAPQPEQAAALQQVAEEEAAAAAATAAQSPGAAQQLGAAKTPRSAVSLGYADSHNPATLGLLRTGGTTRLLGETAQLAEQQAGGGHEEGTGELEEQQGAGGEGQEAADVAGGSAGGATARTNGTTKLLADMTMASMVGAKLLGRPAQGTPELGRGPGSDGLTDFSLDEFELPPELPAGQRQQQQGEAAGMEVEEAAEAGYQHQQAAEEYASPALPAGGEFGAGYPIGAADLSGGGVIPGGPKLARTPVTARATSQPRSAHGTPHSHARSVRSQQQQHMLHSQATPGTHGTHRLARTPGSVRPAAAAYPAEAELTADGMIPGGPKLARTPVGRTPATAYLAGPGSAVAQHYPGSGRMVQFAAGPGSASVGRYPGSAVALHRGGMTPQGMPPPMTFQDFAKLTEVQFLDNLRRGASINYADLQPNPVPQNLAEAYRLLTIISPQVTTLENGIRILQEEVQARRVSAADAEQLVGQLNPAAFQKAQAADEDGLEVLRGHVGLLKKVCRQKAVYCLKDVRRQMEESRGSRLRHNLEVLQADLAFAQASREQLEEVARAAQQYVAEQHSRMAEEEQAHRDEAERRSAVLGMRRSIEEETAANEERRRRLQEAQERVAQLREEHAVLSREREALRSRTDALQMTLMQSQGREGVGRESSPLAILQKLEDLDVLKACVGWQLEGAREDPVSGEAALRLADLFRVRLTISRTQAAASVEVLPEEDCKAPADRRALLAALAGCPEGAAAAAEVQVSEPSAAKVAALVQATTARLSRVADLADELDGLRLAFPALCDVACRPDGWLSLSFVNLDAEVKFGVSLRLPHSYPAGPVQQQARIWFDGEGQITEQRIAQAVAAAAEAPGRLHAICRELSQLARDVMPRPALAQDAAFISNWQNPLFGAMQPALSAQT